VAHVERDRPDPPGHRRPAAAGPGPDADPRADRHARAVVIRGADLLDRAVVLGRADRRELADTDARRYTGRDRVAGADASPKPDTDASSKSDCVAAMIRRPAFRATRRR
jgi:hypothetical protein